MGLAEVTPNLPYDLRIQVARAAQRLEEASLFVGQGRHGAAATAKAPGGAATYLRAKQRRDQIDIRCEQEFSTVVQRLLRWEKTARGADGRVYSALPVEAAETVDDHLQGGGETGPPPFLSNKTVLSAN